MFLKLKDRQDKRQHYIKVDKIIRVSIGESTHEEGVGRDELFVANIYLDQGVMRFLVNKDEYQSIMKQMDAYNDGLDSNLVVAHDKEG